MSVNKNLRVIRSIKELRGWRKNVSPRKRIGVVPTMGALHKGHISLLKRSVSKNDVTVMTLFVNPLQFGKNEDFSKYPRTWKNDCRIAYELGVDVLFAPGTPDITPQNILTEVSLDNLSKKLCGKYRPGHFAGVCTIVLKIFNIVQPHNAYFGKKDFQQFTIIKKMVKDLNIPVMITGMPTIRERSGLAVSSRNEYLSPVEREKAAAIYRSLKHCRKMVKNGEKSIKVLKNEIKKLIQREKIIRIQYLSICSPDTLTGYKTLTLPVLIATACFINKTRLIDNIVVR